VVCWEPLFEVLLYIAAASVWAKLLSPCGTCNPLAPTPVTVSLTSSHFLHLNPRGLFPELQLRAHERGLTSSRVHPWLLNGWRCSSGCCVLLLEKLQCKELPGDSVCCAVGHRGLQRDLGEARGQGRRCTTELGGVTFPSDVQRGVAVNWGINSLLNKTYIDAFSPRKQRIFWITLFSEYLFILAPLVMWKL